MINSKNERNDAYTLEDKAEQVIAIPEIVDILASLWQWVAEKRPSSERAYGKVNR